MNDASAGPLYGQQLTKELLRDCRVLPTRADILPLLPKKAVYCEIGVALGGFSELILNQCDVAHFYAIDTFGLHDAPGMWNGQVGRELAGRNHLRFYEDKFKEYFDSNRMSVLVGDSAEMLMKIPDASVDVFYVDANHSYNAVKRELELIKRKIKNDGWIIMNDYIMEDWVTRVRYGVVQATNEFMIRERWEMVYFALHNGMFCDVVLRKLRSA